ncbi:MAG: hypothetical protein ACERKV_13410, partial [Clostridiaceae bacterium]
MKKDNLFAGVLFCISAFVVINYSDITQLFYLNTIVIFLAGIFLFMNSIDLGGMCLDLTDVLIFSLYGLYGQGPIYIFLILCFLFKIIFSNIKEKYINLRKYLINLSLDIIMVFFSANLVKWFWNLYNGTLDKIKIQIFCVFILGYILSNLFLFNLYKIITKDKTYKFNLVTQFIYGVMPTVICGFIAYVYYYIDGVLDMVFSTIFLLLIILTIYIFNILNNVVKKNNKMEIVQEITKNLMENGELENSMKVILQDIKRLIYYDYAGFYVCSPNYNCKPIVFNGEKKINLNKQLSEIESGFIKTCFLKDDVFIDLDKKRAYSYLGIEI